MFKKNSPVELARNATSKIKDINKIVEDASIENLEFLERTLIDEENRREVASKISFPVAAGFAIGAMISYDAGSAPPVVDKLYSGALLVAAGVLFAYGAMMRRGLHNFKEVRKYVSNKLWAKKFPSLV